MQICDKCKKPIRKNRLHEHGEFCQLCIKFTPIDKPKVLATHFGVKNTFYKGNTSGNDLCDKCYEQWKN